MHTPRGVIFQAQLCDKGKLVSSLIYKPGLGGGAYSTVKRRNQIGLKTADWWDPWMLKFDQSDCICFYPNNIQHLRQKNSRHAWQVNNTKRPRISTSVMKQTNEDKIDIKEAQCKPLYDTEMVMYP